MSTTTSQPNAKPTPHVRVDTVESRELVIKFNGIINELIKIMQGRAKDEATLAGLDRVQRRLGALRTTCGPDETLFLAGPQLYKHRLAIIKREEEFFTKMDIEAEVKKESKEEIKAEDKFVFALAESIKTMYNSSEQEEKDKLYLKVREMLNTYLQYLILCKQAGLIAQ